MNTLIQPCLGVLVTALAATVAIAQNVKITPLGSPGLFTRTVQEFAREMPTTIQSWVVMQE